VELGLSTAQTADTPRGSQYVIARHLIGIADLRTAFEKILLRAGGKPLERLVYNLRASREMKLTREQPLHPAMSRIGDSAIIAIKNYLQATDEDLARANWRISSARPTRVLRLNPSAVVVPLEPPHLLLTLISASVSCSAAFNHAFLAASPPHHACLASRTPVPMAVS